MKKLGIIVGAIVAIVLVICVIPLKEVAYANPMPLTFEASNYTHTDIVEIYRQVGSCGCNRELVEVAVQVVCVNITNTDDIAGNFTIIFFGIDPVSDSYPLIIELSLNASEYRVAECPTESLGDWTYEITPSVKEIDYKKVSLLNYLLHYT